MWRLIKSRFSRAIVFTWASLVGLMIATNGRPSPILLLLVPLATFLTYLSVYVLNDLSDLSVDRINAPNRPLASQSATKADALFLLVILNVGGMAIGFWLGWQAFLTIICVVFLGIVYSVKPFSLKDRFIIKTLTIGIGGMLASTFGGAAVGNVNVSLIYIATMFLVFLFASSPINDLADCVGDALEKRRTIPLVIGSQNTIVLAVISSFTPLISSVLMFDKLGLNVLTLVLLAVVAVRSAQLLLPLLKNSNPKFVRKHHKKMVLLHFLLQGSFAVGSIPLSF